MAKPRTSPIWKKLEDEEFINLVKKSKSIGQVLAFFGLENKGSNYKTVRRRIDELKIDTSHFDVSYKKMISANMKKVIPLEQVLIKNSTYNRKSLKKRIIKEKLLPNNCLICGLNKWNGKDLSLILDHINGDSKDNRLQNLRLVCPNCNSQLETHCGKHNRKNKYYCEDCGSEIAKGSKKCMKCVGQENRIVKDRPSKEILIEEVCVMGFSAVGRKYGVSDNAIRKWIKHTT